MCNGERRPDEVLEASAFTHPLSSTVARLYWAVLWTNTFQSQTDRQTHRSSVPLTQEREMEAANTHDLQWLWQVDKRGTWPLKPTFMADSHIACRAHAVPLSCRDAKGLECVFPIWFWEERHGQSKAWARHGKCESNTAALCKWNGKDTF
jgi:hypothetical protein